MNKFPVINNQNYCPINKLLNTVQSRNPTIKREKETEISTQNSLKEKGVVLLLSDEQKMKASEKRETVSVIEKEQ